MEAQKIHLMLNYYPVIGMVIGVIFLLIGSRKKSGRITRIGLVAFMVVALLALPALVTGEVAGSALGTSAGAYADALTKHKEMARMTIVAIEATGLAALIGLFMFRCKSEPAKWFTAAVMVLSLAACGLAAYTTHLGRQVKWAGSASANQKPVADVGN